MTAQDVFQEIIRLKAFVPPASIVNGKINKNNLLPINNVFPLYIRKLCSSQALNVFLKPAGISLVLLNNYIENVWFHNTHELKCASAQMPQAGPGLAWSQSSDTRVMPSPGSSGMAMA